MLKFTEELETDKLEEANKLSEAGTLEIPKAVAKDVKYWDGLPLKTKEEFFAAYEKLEEDNDHNGCAYLVAKFSKNQKVLQMVLFIAAIHDLHGDTPYELDKLRYILTNPLYKKIAGQK